MSAVKPLPSQESMFPVEHNQMPPINGTVQHAPQEPVFGTAETPVKISLDKRNRHLGESLRMLGMVGRSYGFEQASDPDNPSHRDRLQRRYGGELEEKVENSRSNRDDSRQEGTGAGVMAREHFYSAFGHLALLNGMHKSDVDAIKVAGWKEFKGHFLGPHGRKRRADYRDKLSAGNKTMDRAA